MAMVVEDFFLDSFKEGPDPLTLEIEMIFWGSVTRIFGIPSNFILQNQVKGNLKVVIGYLHSSSSLRRSFYIVFFSIFRIF